MLVSKLGDKGTRVWTGEEPVFLAPYSVPVVSTIGAGDGFASGFLYGLVRGLPVIECLHYGNAAAAIVVSRLSCSEAMPTLGEVEEIIREQRGRPAPAVDPFLKSKARQCTHTVHLYFTFIRA